MSAMSANGASPAPPEGGLQPARGLSPALLTAISLALLAPSSPAWAQCVMCFRTAAAQNSARAHLLNMGIILLGLPPFCILAGFLILAWRRNKTYSAMPEDAQ